MVEKDVLREVPIVGQKSKYEIKKSDHLHLFCTKCFSVTDVALDDKLTKDTKQVADLLSFDIEHRQINLYGICKACN